MVTCAFQRRESAGIENGYPVYDWVNLVTVDCFSVQDRGVALDGVGTTSELEETETRLYFSTLFAPYDEIALKKVRAKDRCIIDSEVYTLKSGAKTILSPFTGAKTTVVDLVKQEGVYDGTV